MNKDILKELEEKINFLKYQIERDGLRNKLVRSGVILNPAEEAEIAEKLDILERRLGIVAETMRNMPEKLIAEMKDILHSLYVTVNAQNDKNDRDYGHNWNDFLNGFDKYLGMFIEKWPFFAISQIEAYGLIADEKIKTDLEKQIQILQHDARQALESITKEYNAVTYKIYQQTQQLEDTIRRGAVKVSVEIAQKEFDEAQKEQKRMSYIWLTASVFVIILFVSFANRLLTITFPAQWTWQILYYSGIRISILVGIGTLFSFTLKMFRSHLHMYHLNRHRQRIASSMSAFVHSAITPEQRDHILAQLVDSVARFGESGLIGKGDDSNYSKISVESVAGTIIPSLAKAQKN